MTIMTTNRSIAGDGKWLTAAGLVAALCVSLATASAPAVGQERDSALTPPAAAPAVAAPAAPAAAAAQPDAAVLLERARKKIKVDHDVAGGVAAYREVIEKHRADLAHARPALRELLDLWVEVQGNEAAAAAIRPAAEKYLDMQRPIDPQAAAARTDDDLTRDLLLKPWLVTLKFDKAPLKDVLAEITRQSGVAIDMGKPLPPFDAARYRAFMKKLPRYAELPEEERKQLRADCLTMEGYVAQQFPLPADLDLHMRQRALNAAAEPRESAARIELFIKQREEAERANNEVNRATVSVDVVSVTALAAIDAVVAAAKPTRLSVGNGSHSFAVVLAHPGNHDDTHIAYSGRMRIAMSERNWIGQRYYANDAWKSTVSIPLSVLSECGFETCVLQNLVGTDQAGREHNGQDPGVVALGQPTSMPECVFDVRGEVNAFVSLAGELEATAVVEQRQHRLPLTVGSEVHNDSHALTIAAISKADGIAYLTLRFTHKDPAERSAFWDSFALADFLTQVAYVELADGKQVGLSVSKYDQGADGKAICHTSFRNGQVEPAALVFNEAIKKVPVTIPFEFKNVKLP